MSEGRLRNSWIIDKGHAKGLEIFLLTLEEFRALPLGTQLIDIFGDFLNKTPKTDEDTRGGYVAYGLAARAASAREGK